MCLIQSLQFGLFGKMNMYITILIFKSFPMKTMSSPVNNFHVTKYIITEMSQIAVYRYIMDKLLVGSHYLSSSF